MAWDNVSHAVPSILFGLKPTHALQTQGNTCAINGLTNCLQLVGNYVKTCWPVLKKIRYCTQEDQALPI